MSGGGPNAAGAREFRAQLGLPTDRPVVMSGHQASWWHAGILAKWFALEAAATAAQAAPAWLVVDTDLAEFGELHFPTRAPAGASASPPDAWTRGTWGVHPSAGIIARDTTAGGLPAFTPTPPPALHQSPGDSALAQAHDGMARLHAALLAHRASASAAHQAAHAAADLIAELAPGDPGARPALLFASTLAETELFGECLRRMRADPLACWSAYNHAVGAFARGRGGTPGASGAGAMTPLAHDAAFVGAAGAQATPGRGFAGRLELPLWIIDPEGRRRRAWTSDLDGPHAPTLLPHNQRGVPPSPATASASMRFVPRALLLTGLLRMAGCDLFIHGTGGGGGTSTAHAGYDRVTEAWLGAWMPTWRLAPTAVASATLLLPLLDRAPTTAEQAREAACDAHRARHNPLRLGDSEAQLEKLALARAIARAPRRAHADAMARRALYTRLHELLRAARDEHATALGAMADRARDLATRAKADALAADRTWPFMLHDASALRALRQSIEAKFSAARS